MDKAERREQRRFKRRYAPTTTNPGLRIIARDLARKAQVECDDCGRKDGTHDLNVEH